MTSFHFFIIFLDKSKIIENENIHQFTIPFCLDKDIIEKDLCFETLV